ncbi:MAG: hypothetical protein JWM62_40, partial [Frankiales bacterium]|nr:hypothetical protein [Frankiales bacterium]
GVAALSAVALACAGLMLPGLLGGGERVDRVAVSPADPRFPEATSAVATLAELNGGEVVTFFKGISWCTASVRAAQNQSCGGFVGKGRVGAFAYTTVPGQASVRVDDDEVMAGVLGTDVVRVVVQLEDGSEVEASTTSPQGFPRPVWWVAVPSGARVQEATAYDADAQAVATMDVR